MLRGVSLGGRSGIWGAGAVAFAGLALILLAIPALAEARVFAPHNCQRPAVEPRKIVLACAGGSAFVKKIDYGRWGGNKTRGKGTFFRRSCEPSCAEGRFERFRVKFVLLKIRRTACGGRRVRLYTELRMRFVGQEPEEGAAAWRRNTLFCLPG